MIRLYAFYSVGGYKDMYLGSLSQEASSTYYLPLLFIIKKRNNPQEQEHIAALEKLPRVEIINQHNDWGFPDECNKLFSHGGYTIIYKTLRDGMSCLAIRNLTGSMRDEEGRSTPFNLLFIAENEEDNYTLDKVALYCKDHSQEISSVLSPTIVYDAFVNGLRVDLQNIYNWICSLPNTTPLLHNANRVNYVMVSNEQMIDIVVKEQKLSDILIDAIFQDNGDKLQGSLKYAQAPINIVKSTNTGRSNDESAESKGKKPIDDHKQEENLIVNEKIDIVHTEESHTNHVESAREEDATTIRTTKDAGACFWVTRAIGYLKRLFDLKSNKECIEIFSIPVPIEYVQWIILGVAIVCFLIGLIF